MGIIISTGDDGYPSKLKTPVENYFNNEMADLSIESSYIYTEEDEIDLNQNLFYFQNNNNEVDFKYSKLNSDNSLSTKIINGLRRVPSIKDKDIKLNSSSQATLYTLLKEGFN